MERNYFLKHSPWKFPSHTLQIRCTDCPIRHRTVCGDCGPSELKKLDALKSYKSYQAGEIIVSAGDKVEFLGSVMSGVATLSRSLIDGRRQMVGLLLPSDFIGRPRQKVSPFDVVAVGEVTVCQFRKSQFETLVLSIPALEHRLLEMAMDELDAAHEWMLMLGRKSAREKVSSLLVILAHHDAAQYGHSPADGLFFPALLTRADMADYLGLTLETVSRHISALKNDGTIVLDDSQHICVPDFAMLLNEAGDDSDGGIVS